MTAPPPGLTIFQLAEGETGGGAGTLPLLYRAQPRNFTHHFHSYPTDQELVI